LDVGGILAFLPQLNCRKRMALKKYVSLVSLVSMVSFPLATLMMWRGGLVAQTPILGLRLVLKASKACSFRSSDSRFGNKLLD
jgi:hypothetical protein